MEEHFEEEQRLGLLLLRANFTYDEFKPIEARVVGSLSSRQLGGIFGPLESEARSAFLKQAGVPWLVMKLRVMPAVRKYER